MPEPPSPSNEASKDSKEETKEETAKEVYRTLTAHHLGRPANSPAPVHRFLATGDPEPFALLGRRFLGPEVRVVEQTPEWVTAG